MKPRRRIPWKTLSTKTAYENPWFFVTDSKVVRPDGKRGTYSVLHTRGGSRSVYIIPIDDKGRTLLHYKYRYPTKTWSWEIPAGGVNDGESPLTAAKRELVEESGLTAKRWAKLGEYQAQVGISSEWMHVFLARELARTKATGQLEEGIVKEKFVTFAEALSMINRHEMTDSQSISSLTLAALYLKKI
jgi:8-oxo-dGTP pyrophosphatase MutT (NUDIX family)